MPQSESPTPGRQPQLQSKASSSLAMLQESATSSAISSEAHGVAHDEAREDPSLSPEPASSPLVVTVSLRRGRIALLTVAVVVVIATLTLFFRHGYEIERFDKAELTAEDQKDLLDRYNSYSGNIASVFGKPIEVFVAACVQVTVLRFVSASLLRAEPSWKAVHGALVLSAVVGYLINNGFNSLNVQLRDLEVKPVVKASDLSLNETANAQAEWGSRITTVNQSVSEAHSRNPITNTV